MENITIRLSTVNGFYPTILSSDVQLSSEFVTRTLNLNFDVYLYSFLKLKESFYKNVENYRKNNNIDKEIDSELINIHIYIKNFDNHFIEFSTNLDLFNKTLNNIGFSDFISKLILYFKNNPNNEKISINDLNF